MFLLLLRWKTRREGKKKKQGGVEKGRKLYCTQYDKVHLWISARYSLPQIRVMLLICFPIPDIWRKQDFSQAHSKVNRKHLVLLLLAALSNVSYAGFYLQITIRSLISTHQECHFFFPLVLTYALLTKTLWKFSPTTLSVLKNHFLLLKSPIKG